MFWLPARPRPAPHAASRVAHYDFRGATVHFNGTRPAPPFAPRTAPPQVVHYDFRGATVHFYGTQVLALLGTGPMAPPLSRRQRKRRARKERNHRRHSALICDLAERKFVISIYMDRTIACVRVHADVDAGVTEMQAPDRMDTSLDAPAPTMRTAKTEWRNLELSMYKRLRATTSGACRPSDAFVTN
ncbi:hypothetical protein HIM_02932 [Hirsutella minnesotensis 3608]|nr:hypothetical protein HIM_02932 [Hirsutella minnesotensis 3608]